MNEALVAAVSAFGASAKSKLANVAVTGAPEDQLRGPLEAFVRDLSEIAGLPPDAVHLVGEASLAELKTRPDFAATVRNALVGFMEVKAPGKGADPRRFKDPHDKAQWERLKSLPNLIYTDGNAFSLWRDGKLVGSFVHLEGDIETAGAALKAPPSLLALFTDFLNWEPIPPRTAKQLAEISARLCRLLRDEVIVRRESRDMRKISEEMSEWKARPIAHKSEVYYDVASTARLLRTTAVSPAFDG